MDEQGDKINPLESLEGWLRNVIREEIRAAMGQNGHGSSHEPPTLLTVKDLAKTLKVRESRIYELIRNRDNPIPHIRIGRYPRFELSKVLPWLEEKGKH